MTQRTSVIIGIIVLLAALSPVLVQAQTNFYAGKTVTIQIGFSAGGSDDAWGHLIAQYLEKYLPGNPTVVPENMPGAGSLRVANEIYNIAPKDGTVIGMISRGIPFEPLLGGKNIQFDALKMDYIGSPSTDTSVCAARKGAAVKTIQDLFTKELIVGATGSGADSAAYPQILSRLLGMKFKIITGYPGQTEIGIAMERNELQGICGVSYDELERQPLAREGKLNILFQAALIGDPRLKGIPLVIDFAKSGIRKQALALFLTRASIGRPIVAPPGLPAGRLEALRKAFAESLADPGFIEMAKKEKLRIHLTTGEEIATIIAAAYKTPKDVIRRTSKALGYIK